MNLDKIKIGDRWETVCDKTPRNRIGSHHVTITHLSSDHIMGIYEERRLTWDRLGNPIGKAHTFGRLDRPCICISLILERKTTGSGIIFWGGKGVTQMNIIDNNLKKAQEATNKISDILFDAQKIALEIEQMRLKRQREAIEQENAKRSQMVRNATLTILVGIIIAAVFIWHVVG